MVNFIYLSQKTKIYEMYGLDVIYLENNRTQSYSLKG